MYLSAQSVAPYKSPFTSNPIHPAIFLPVFRAAVQNRASEELPAMAASASGVGALSSALSALHLTRTSTSRFTRKFRSLSPRVRSSSTFLSSSSLSYTGKLTRPRPETDDRKALSSADDDGFTVSQLDLPWIGGADGKVSSAQQSRTAERFLQSLVDATPRRKKKSSSLSKVDTGQRAVSEPPKYSKAARRYFNERFREPPQRLSKVLAASGVAARRSCEELIFDGRVTVNGSVCNTPQTRVDPARDIIYVNGRRLPKKLPPKVYLALNKPKGYICSCGEKESKSVLCLFDDFLKSWDKRNPGQRKPRLFTVGRLDVATTGLILITNDGEFAQKVSHPSSNLTKEYIAAIDGAVHKRQLVTISKGTVIDGVHCIPDFVELLPDQPDVRRTRIRIVVHEGRNHEVRELVKNAGLQIHSLKRTRIGGFRLPNDLRLGKHIELKQNDLKALGWKS